MSSTEPEPSEDDDLTDTTQPVRSHDAPRQASPSNPKSSDDGDDVPPPILDEDDFLEPAPQPNDGEPVPADSFGIADDSRASRRR